MRNLNPQAIADKWATRVQQSGQLYQQGVQAVTENPAQKAIAQADVWLANVGASRDRYVSGLQNTTLESWKTATTDASSRYTGGTTKGRPKQAAFFTQFIPFLQQAVQALPPRGNREQNKTRATQLMDALARFRVQRRSM